MIKSNKKTAVLRGGDEYSFLGSRAKSTPLGAALARQRLADLSRRVLSVDGAHGAEAHDQGTELVELYMRHADASLGFRSFASLLMAHWPLDQSVAYERMKIARLCTHEQAARYGQSACALGLRVMNALGIERFDQFLKRPLKLHAAEGGRTVHFPCSARELRSVLREIATRAATGHAPDVAEQLRSFRGVIDEMLEDDPTLATLRPVAWADAKGAYLRVTAGNATQARAAIRLYQKLARLVD